MPPRGPSIGAVLLLAIAVAVLVVESEGEDGGSNAPDGGRVDGPVPVTEVVDGDTIHVSIDGEDETVRYIGIDTPEVDPSIGVECFGKRASERNAQLVGGERVVLEVGRDPRDRYDRLLAYVYVGDELINAELLRGGFARTLEISPNTDKAEEFAGLEQDAAAAGRGLWGTC